MSDADGIGGTDGARSETPVTTRHHEYAGRYETIRRHMALDEFETKLPRDIALLGQCALILCDLLEEMAQVRAQLTELNAMNLELIVHRRPL